MDNKLAHFHLFTFFFKNLPSGYKEVIVKHM